MSYLDSNVPPMKVLVRKEFLYDEEDHHGEYVEGILVNVKSIQGLALTFQVLLSNGSLRDKLPVSALCHKPCDKPPLDQLQLWDCPSYQINTINLNFLTGLRCAYFTKERKWEQGEYLWTFNWSGQTVTELDLSLAEEPSEHKSGHFIQLDNGNFAIQPNNRMRFYESSFVTEPFPEKPDYKVCTKAYKVERADKWVTENSDAWMYDIEEKE
jgi:hypothetical protein